MLTLSSLILPGLWLRISVHDLYFQTSPDKSHSHSLPKMKTDFLTLVLTSIQEADEAA
jgi:hypothetical protein